MATKSLKLSTRTSKASKKDAKPGKDVKKNIEELYEVGAEAEKGEKFSMGSTAPEEVMPQEPNQPAGNEKPASDPVMETSSKPSEPDYMRFSTRADVGGRGNSRGKMVRVLGFILIVIIIGVGLLYVVQNFISNQQQSTVNQSSTTSLLTIAGADIGTTILKDSLVADLTPNADYSDATVKLGSIDNDVKGTVVTKLIHNTYSTFTRTIWEFGEFTGMPSTTAQYDNTKKTITVDFTGIAVEDEDLLQAIPIGVGNVSSITGSETKTGTQFVLQLKADSKYSMFIDGKSVVLDVKTETQLKAPASTSTTTSAASSTATSSKTSTTSSASSSTTSAASGDKPAAPHYENEPSQGVQYVSSKVTSNSISLVSYPYQDFGPKFRLSFKLNGLGENFIPNARAELKQEDGQVYIELVINNLNYDLARSSGWTNLNLSGANLTYSNLKEAQFKSYSDGTSTYWLILGHVANYQLFGTLTKDDKQLLTVDVFD